MFMFDIETLGVESNSVILSMACIHFDPANKTNHQQLREDAFFAKFDVNDQVHRLGRKIDKDTVDWWKKQCENARKASFIPNPKYDVKYEVGCESMREWVKRYNEKDTWVWARGSLDQVVFDSITKQCGLDTIFTFNQWRDVRTAVDFLYNTKNGYCKVEVPPWEEFDPFLHITKHNPIDDCIYDVMMLQYGVPNDETT